MKEVKKIKLVYCKMVQVNSKTVFLVIEMSKLMGLRVILYQLL